jgi:sigma-B regulation protein RsbU (phosphoserine phosphatase)
MTDALQAQLQDRRVRLQAAITETGEDERLLGLLREVDLALERARDGTYGLCEVCHDSIEADRLTTDPLITRCLDHLTSAEVRALEQDLELASRVQRTLLPPRDLARDGWEMAYHYAPIGAVSGDYCDVVGPASDDGGRVFFLLGDISGKGVAASMLMAHLHAAVRTLLGIGLPIDQVLARTNRLFCESTPASRYATLVCGGLTASGQVELCNAGHCPPLLVRAGEVTSLAATGLPVGMFCTADYSVSRLTLASGDALVLYTDGLTESRDRSDAEYGTERLLRVLARRQAAGARDLVNSCVNDLSAFLSGASRADDLTVMAIRRI